METYHIIAPADNSKGLYINGLYFNIENAKLLSREIDDFLLDYEYTEMLARIKRLETK